jgi:predicted nucleotidyltransferase
MTRQDVLAHLEKHAAEIRRRFGVRRLAIFGSVARDAAGETSDVDVLVEFEGRAGFDRFMDLKFHLEDTLGSRIDLVTRNALRPSLRARIEAEAVDVA